MVDWSSLSELSSQGLKIRDRNSESHQPVVIRVARLRKRVLCVHDFQDGGLSTLITQVDQAQALGCELDRLTEHLELRPRGLRFVVKRAQVRQQSTLCRA